MHTEVKCRSVSAASCADVQLKVASTSRERQASFELVYSSYVRAGLCDENRCGLRITPYQLLDTTDIIIAELGDDVISTLSLVRDGELGLPMEEIYPEEVASRRNAGVRLAEVSCLADRRERAPRFFQLFCELSRVMAQLAAQTGVDELLVSVHPRHAPLYRRYMAFEPIGDCRDYPTVLGNPAVALSLNFAHAREHRAASWQEFFGQPLPPDVLVSAPISDADREYFLSLLERCGQCRHRFSLEWAHIAGSATAETCRLCA
jgi:hypothetical protein